MFLSSYDANKHEVAFRVRTIGETIQPTFHCMHVRARNMRPLRARCVYFRIGYGMELRDFGQVPKVLQRLGLVGVTVKSINHNVHVA